MAWGREWPSPCLRLFPHIHLSFLPRRLSRWRDRKKNPTPHWQPTLILIFSNFFSCPVLKRLCHRWPQVKDISLAAPSRLVRFSSLSFINWWKVRTHLGLGCRTRPRTGFKRCNFKSYFQIFVLSALGGPKTTRDFIHNKSDARASPLDCVPPGAEWRPPEEAATRAEVNRADWRWMNIWRDLD